MNTHKMDIVKRVAIVAHESRKNDLIEWSFHNREILKQHEIIANGYTADVLEGTLNVPVCKLLAGSIGGYHQLSEMITSKKVDAIIFLWQTKNSDSFDVDTKTLLDLAEAEEIVIATNMATAQALLSSAFLNGYEMEALDGQEAA
jgi:methylglyoxal synthase